MAKLQCPECGKEPDREIWALMTKRDDDGKERVCQIVFRCTDRHGPYARWADRPEGAIFPAGPGWAEELERLS
jgi:adenine-specific DNA methylase